LKINTTIHRGNDNLVQKIFPMASCLRTQCMPHFHSKCFLAKRKPLYPARASRIVGIQKNCTGAIPGAGKLGRRTVLQKMALLSVFIAGNNACGGGVASQNKKTNLSIEEIKSIIENDISKGQYYVTGDMTKEIYENNCRFRDPTTDLTGLEKYISAVKFLFNPNTSKQELLSIAVVDPHTIEAKWRLEGYLKFPWNPHILPYEGSTRYVLDDRGLIMSHEETWDISVWTALQEFLLPSWMPT